MTTGTPGRRVKPAGSASGERSPVAVQGRPSPHQNHLLDALPAGRLRADRTASGAGSRCRSATCSTSLARRCGTSISRPPAIVSLLYVMEDGASAEIAIVGNEGMLGISLFMGGETTPSRAVVQSAGHAFRLEGRAAQGGVRAVRPDDAPAVALHPGADHPDGADRGLQSAPLGRSATVPVAVAEPRSAGLERALDDAGTDRQHARRASRRGHRGRGEVAGRRA